MNILAPARWSVRVRTGLAAALALAPVLVLASVVAVSVQRHDLTDSVALVAEEQARTQARDLALAATGTDLDAALDGSLGGEETLIQVVGPDGVEAASPGLADAPLAPDPGSGASRVIVQAVVEGEPDRFVAVAVPVAGSDRYVVAARSLETTDEAVGSTPRLLLVGAPTLVLVVAVLGWALAGRALAPVERLRRSASEITHAGSGSRLPEPAGDDEIAHLATTLNEMLVRLDASARSQRQFVADASHELRSPVATIRTLLEVDALSPADPAGLREDLLDETARLERLVNALLALARRDATGPQPGVRDHDVRLVDLVEDEARRQRHLPVEVRMSGDPRVFGDPQALAGMIGNLLDNAERHAVSRIEADISTDPTSREVTVTVTDDGPGVPAADRERIFDRFVRLDQARDRDAGGSGLGLAIARAVAEDHGGTLVCEAAQPPPGARFVVTLPLAGSPDD
jgi:signal transduction histidine kinase